MTYRHIAWHARGQRFEPAMLHHIEKISATIAIVAFFFSLILSMTYSQASGPASCRQAPLIDDFTRKGAIQNGQAQG